MPFGVLKATKRKEKPAEKPIVEEKRIVEPPVEPVVKPVETEEDPLIWKDTKGRQVHVLLAGRNLALIREFLCAMNQNLNEALQPMGMTCFTRELATITEISGVKKRLEQFFWNFSQQDWGYPEDTGAPQSYTFCISPSAEQQTSLDLIFHCVTPKTAADLTLAEADGVWLLTDGALTLADDAADGYETFLCRYLREAPSKGKSGVPVCLVLTQIEGVARFVSARGKVSIPKEQEQRLWKMAARLVETSGRDQDALAVCLPVQVYDGLECVRTDEKGDPILHLSQDGYHQSYRPLNCQLPALYTLQTVAESDGTDFFEGMVPVRSFLGGVRQHYGQIFGAPDWQPIICGGKEQG